MEIDLSKFVQATPSNLQALAPGCFAQISDDRCGAVWVEIDGVNNGTFTGFVRSELCSTDSFDLYQNKQRVSFLADRVEHLGCNRYCFC